MLPVGEADDASEPVRRAVLGNQREALELSFFNGLSHREIAAATSTPLGTVKTRLELGLHKLTQSIKPLRNKL